MASEPEELWLAAAQVTPDAETPVAEASRTVDVPDGLEGWPRPGRRFWAGLLCEEGARFLDTLAALVDEDTARALFGEGDRPATRLLVLLFDCFGGLYAPGMDWRTWCAAEDPVLVVCERLPLSADPDLPPLDDHRLASELRALCAEIFPDHDLRPRPELRVTVEAEGRLRVGPAPLVRLLRCASARPLRPAGRPVAPAAGRKRKAGGLHPGGADGRGDGAGVGAAGAHGRDGGDVGDHPAGPEGEAPAEVLAVALAEGDAHPRKVRNRHNSSGAGAVPV